MIKWASIIILLAGIAACGSKPSTPTEQKTDEIMADILVRSGGKPTVEITFYTPISEIVNGKENKGFGKNVIAVQDPQFNGSPLTAGTNLSGQPIYKIGVDNAAARNVISATVNGKLYEGTSIIEIKMMNKMTTMVLEPK